MINEPGYRLNVGIVIINDKGKLLLCKRKNIDSWQFPQGGINEGESPINASKQELFEEVGINIIQSITVKYSNLGISESITKL